MDEKFFVPFETELLLKKKGYNGICDYYYAPDKQLYFGATRISNDTLDYENNGTVAAPTYHEVVDWLEKKWYPVEVMWTREHSELVWNCLVDHEMTKNYPTRERAINAAILKVLEKL